MTRTFSIKLAERIVTTFFAAFLSTYVLGLGDYSSLQHVDALPVSQKALAAAGAAVLQLLLSTTVAPHVGDKDSPSLLPTALLKRLGGLPAPAQQQIVVALDDVVQHLAEKYPDVKLSADEVAKALLDHAPKA